MTVRSREHARAAAIKSEIEKVTGEACAERFVCAPDAFLKWFQFASALADMPGPTEFTLGN